MPTGSWGFFRTPTPVPCNVPERFWLGGSETWLQQGVCPWRSPFFMVNTIKMMDFHGQTVSFREVILCVYFCHLLLLSIRHESRKPAQATGVMIVNGPRSWTCGCSPWWECTVISAKKTKLDPKWVPERAKHSGRKIWHEMKGPWRLSPIEHNPKITNLFSRRAFLVTPRWWRSTWRFPITDNSWNVDIHARKSKRGRRANQVKSNNSRQISQVE